jgi:prolyl oligopeptidase
VRQRAQREQPETRDEKGRRGGASFFLLMLRVLRRVSPGVKAGASALLILACTGLGALLKPLVNAAAGQITAVVDSLPVAPVRPVTDDYFGTKVVDPYRYMENLQDPKVQAWMKAQNDYTRAVLASIPGRQQLLERIVELDQSVPQVFAGRLPGDLYMVGKMLPSDNTWKLYLRPGLNGQDRLLVDPEKITLAPADQGKGKNVIGGLAVSNEGQYIAFGIVPGGDELHGELHVIEAATGRESPM